MAEETARAILRDIRLNQPSNDIHFGDCVAIIRVDSAGAAELRDAANGILHFMGTCHHKICQFIYDNNALFMGRCPFCWQ